MIAFRWLFPGLFSEVVFRVVRDSSGFKTLSLGGICDCTCIGCISFLAVSVLSLLVAVLFRTELCSSEAIRRRGFLKRQYKTVAALLGLLLPAFASAQEHAGGGEANLTLPDLRSVISRISSV